MADRLSNLNMSYFDYANYWRPSASLGTTLFRSSTKMDKLQVKHKWQIITITSCVIIAVTLVIGIYNAVIYKNISNSPPVLILTTNSDTTSTTTTLAAAAATTTTTTPSTTTAAITSVAVDTTYPDVVSTDAVTTKTPPICPSMLPFREEAGDEASIPSDGKYPFGPFVLWNETIDNGIIDVTGAGGILKILSNNATLHVRVLYTAYPKDKWTAFHRNVSSKTEQDAISCLVNNSRAVNAFVYTWAKKAPKDNEEFQAVQFIIAAFESSATYVIRIYSQSLPHVYMSQPVQIIYRRDPVLERFFNSVTHEDVAGQRQIFDVSKPLKEGQNLTVVEEGKNCNIFLC